MNEQAIGNAASTVAPRNCASRSIATKNSRYAIHGANDEENLVTFPRRRVDTYFKVDTRNRPGTVWAWDLLEVRGEVVNYGTPWVTFQWMIDERAAILI